MKKRFFLISELQIFLIDTYVILLYTTCMKEPKSSPLRKIPSIDKILSSKELKPYLERFSRGFVKNCTRELLLEVRKGMLKKREKGFSLKQFLDDLKKTLPKKNQNMKRVINATGIVLNTNLGRAPLPGKVIDEIKPILTGYSNLEYDIQKGERGKRYDHLIGILRELTGAEDGLVVNNNAGAVLLCLDTFAKGKEVVVSRGQLVEIGGSFRLHEILLKSGARLVEVGTTNRTYIDDFRRGITPDSKMLLLSHRSNFKMVGFTNDPKIEEVVLLGKAKGLMTMMDLGSGLFISMKRKVFESELTVQDVLKRRVDLVCFSGDKLLGGPQAGIILSPQKEFITMMKSNPLLRALRIDKFTVSVLEKILRIYLYSDKPAEELPLLKMAFLAEEGLKKRAFSLRKKIASSSNGKLDMKIKKGFSEMGGGSMPGELLPTYLVVMRCKKIGESKFLRLLGENIPPIIARIEKGWIVMDPRTIFPEEFDEIEEAIRHICKEY